MILRLGKHRWGNYWNLFIQNKYLIAHGPMRLYYVINVEKCSSSTTYNGDIMTHRTQQK